MALVEQGSIAPAMMLTVPYISSTNRWRFRSAYGDLGTARSGGAEKPRLCRWHLSYPRDNIHMANGTVSTQSQSPAIGITDNEQ